MFKFLKNKQNIQFILVYALLFAFVIWSSSFWLDDGSEQIDHKLDQLDQEVTELSEDIDRLGQSVDAYVNIRSKFEDALRESNELLRARLEQYKELFIQFEQRITLLQDLLHNADPDSTDLMTVQAEIADILQSLKHINEMEADDLAE